MLHGLVSCLNGRGKRAWCLGHLRLLRRQLCTDKPPASGHYCNVNISTPTVLAYRVCNLAVCPEYFLSKQGPVKTLGINRVQSAQARQFATKNHAWNPHGVFASALELGGPCDMELGNCNICIVCVVFSSCMYMSARCAPQGCSGRQSVAPAQQ